MNDTISEPEPKIGPPTMGPVKRFVIGIICLIISLSIFFVILMVLEHFKANAPKTRSTIKKTRELRRNLRRTRERKHKR